MLRRLPATFCFICFGIGLLGIIGSMLPMFSDAEENFGLHLLYRLRGPEKPRADVVVIAIDRESASAFNLPTSANKWPRTLHAKLLEALTKRGVSVVVFDLIFHEPQSSENDRLFAEAVARAGNVILTQPINRQILPLPQRADGGSAQISIEKMISAIPIISDAALGQAPFPLPKVPIKLNQFWRFSPGSGDVPTLPVVAMQIHARDAFEAFVDLLEKVDSTACDVLPARSDGSGRFRHIIDSIGPIYSLFEKDATLAHRMTAELDQLYPSKSESRVHRLVRALIELYGSGNSRYLNLYGPPKTIDTISYHRLLNSVVDSSDQIDHPLPTLKGKTVFVGQTESDWFKANDGFYTTFTDSSGLDVSGVEIAATAFANLLEDKAVRPLRPMINLVFHFGWGAVITLISLHFRTVVSGAGLLLLSSLHVGLAHFQFSTSGTWHPLVVPILVQVPAAFMAGLAWKYHRANIERKNIRQAFGRYLPDAVVEQLAGDIKGLRAGGQVLYSICMFTDAESYTTLSEELDPESLTQLMNSYYEAIFKPVKDNGGIILQVIGDSVLSLWTASRPRKKLKAAACKAALGIAEAVRKFNATAGDYQLPTRIGIHAGEILLGNIGAIDHFEYRPVGDIVNTASRLEGLNKYLGTRMLASEDALGVVNGSISRPMGRFVFKGKSMPVRVYEILQNDSGTEALYQETHRIFAAGLQAFELQSWDEADHLFQEVLRLDETDGPSKFYLRLCRRLRRLPPGSDWNGSVHLYEK